MNEKIKITSDLLRGHSDTMILKLLLEEDRYGYEITKQISILSLGEYELNEATMYSSLKRLEKDGAIVSYWGDQTRGSRRKYYKITPQGKEVYKKKYKNWQMAKKVLDKLL